jgi:hypothetical protein
MESGCCLHGSKPVNPEEKEKGLGGMAEPFAL